MNVDRPPYFARNLLRLTLPRGIVREAVVGDLGEEFSIRCREHGREIAARWYRREASAVMWYGMRRTLQWRKATQRSPSNSPHEAPKPGRVNRSTVGAAVWQDLRAALRALRRTPWFTTVSAGTMALGIGATVMVFSVVDGVLLRPLPYLDADELVQVGFQRESGRVSSVYAAFFDAWRDGSTHLTDITANVGLSHVLASPGEPTALSGAGVSPEYFSLLGVPMALGQGFGPQHNQPGAGVVVISSSIWRTRWASDSGIVGRSIVLDDTTYTVIGVVDSDFHPPELLRGGDIDYWMPIRSLAWFSSTRDAFIQVIARIADQSNLELVRQELRRLSEPVVATYPANYADYFVPDARPMLGQTVGNIATRLFALFGAVAGLLLIACANVANLFMARGTDRVRELTVRTALGAGRARIARLVLFESVLVAGMGSIVGTCLAAIGLHVFRRMSPGDVPRLTEVTIDFRVLGFSVVVALLTGILFGLLPALAATGRSATEVLSSAPGRLSAGREKLRLRDAFVVIEMALTLMLAIGAGLMLNSFMRLSWVDPGFAAANVEIVRVRLGSSYTTKERREAFFDELLERTRAQPSVAAAALALDVPMGGGSVITTTYLDGAQDASIGMIANHRITPAYFEVLGMTVRTAGIPSSGGADGQRVVFVNEAFAQRYWPGVSPLGRRLRLGDSDSEPFEVLGVANDVRHDALAAPPEPQVYTPYRTADFSISSMHLLVRSAGGSAPAGPVVRRLVHDLDPSIPLGSVVTMSDRIAGSIAEPRFYTTLFATFAATAIALAAVGIFSTMTYSVTRRSKELGIRMALGAAPGRVFTVVLRQAAVVTMLGAVLGIAGAIGVTRILTGFLFGVTATDPVTFVTAAGLLGGVAMLACIAPARRATTVDPVQSLRVE